MSSYAIQVIGPRAEAEEIRGRIRDSLRYHRQIFALKQFFVGREAIRIGGPLTDFQGVLTGTPTFRGEAGTLMGPRDA